MGLKEEKEGNEQVLKGEFFVGRRHFLGSKKSKGGIVPPACSHVSLLTFQMNK